MFAVLFLGAIFFSGAIVINILALLFILIGGQKYLSSTFSFILQKSIQFWIKTAHFLGIAYVHGREHLDYLNIKGGNIIVSNHPSWMDAIIILSQVKHCSCFYKSKWYFSPFFKFSSILLGNINNEHPIRSIKKAIRILNSNQNLLIFPEGSRSKNIHKTNDLKNGFSLISKQTKGKIEVFSLHMNFGLLSSDETPVHFSKFPLQYTIRPLGNIKTEDYENRQDCVTRLQELLDSSLSITHE